MTQARARGTIAHCLMCGKEFVRRNPGAMIVAEDSPIMDAAREALIKAAGLDLGYNAVMSGRDKWRGLTRSARFKS